MLHIMHFGVDLTLNTAGIFLGGSDGTSLHYKYCGMNPVPSQPLFAWRGLLASISFMHVVQSGGGQRVKSTATLFVIEHFYYLT